MKQHVLIVDDDEMMQNLVGFLVKDGLELRTTQVANALDMHAVLKHDDVDLLVLDLGLPDEDGLVLARQVKSRGNIPILILTGDNKKETLVSALEIGVQDFVTKPFDPYELQLRIKNLLKNFRGRKSTQHLRTRNKFRFGEFVLSIEQRSLSSAGTGNVHLTYNEFNILCALAQSPGKALSRAVLLDAIAKGADAPTDRAIDVYISQLRQKLEPDTKTPRYIVSVRGYGYKLCSELG